MKQLTKKWLILLFTIVTVFCFALGLAACDPDDNGEITLSAPVITLDGNTISWEAVENATRYIVYEGDEETGTNVTETSYTINKTEPGDYVFTVAAYNAEANPKIGPKSNEVTYTVTGNDGTGPDDNGGGDDTTEPLSVPEVELEGNALNWTAVEGAVAYDIYKNDEKVDTVESFNFLFADVLPTTYTLTDAEDGDKYQVAAISGDEEVEDSELSEEVEYTAVGSTLSLSDSVYVTDATTTITVNATASRAYKVIFKLNNDMTFSGASGVGSISVRGAASQNEAPYAADATLEDGVYVAGIVISGEATLYLNITSMFEEVSLGFTVSLEDYYTNTTVNTYTLGATGEVEVVIPYGIGGYNIRVNLDNVPATGNVLYVIAEDGDVGMLNISTQSGGLQYHEEGYYQSNAFSATAGYITLSASDRIDVKATISFDVPEAALAAIPELTVSQSLYAQDISNAQSAPSTYRVNNVENGNYILLLQARIEGLTFYGKLDNGNYVKLSNSSNLYSLNLTINNNTYLYLYVSGEPENAEVPTISLIAAGSQSYDLSETEPAEDAFIGAGAANATVFNLINVEPGEYTLTITGSTSGLSFTVNVGSTSYTLSTYVDKWPEYIYSKDITIENEQSISIYLSSGIQIATVSLTKVVEEVLPELTHGSNGVKFNLTALYGSDASQSFKLADVPNGTYTVVLTGFVDMYDSWVDMKILVGSQTKQICQTEGGYLGDQQITINGETELTVAIYNAHATLNLTIYLLAEGETLGGGGDSNSITTDLTIDNGFWSKVDISGLPAGEYSISITNNSGAGDPEYTLSFDYLNEDDLTSFGGNPYANGTFSIPEGGKSELWIKLEGVANPGYLNVTVTIELVGGGNQGGGELVGGGSETYLNKTAEVGSAFAYAGGPGTLDVSSLAYGEYKIYFVITGFSFEEIQTVYFTCNSTIDDSVDTAVDPQTWGTVTINGDTLYIYSYYISGVEISIELEKVDGGSSGGGDLVGGGSGTYLNKTAEVGSAFAYAGGPGTLDVSSLAYGEYKIYFVITGFSFEETQTVYFTCNSTLDDGVDTAVDPQTWGTVTINGDTLYIYSYYISGVEISIELEKV